MFFYLRNIKCWDKIFLPLGVSQNLPRQHEHNDFVPMGPYALLAMCILQWWCRIDCKLCNIRLRIASFV